MAGDSRLFMDIAKSINESSGILGMTTSPLLAIFETMSIYGNIDIDGAVMSHDRVRTRKHHSKQVNPPTMYVPIQRVGCDHQLQLTQILGGRTL